MGKHPYFWKHLFSTAPCSTSSVGTSLETTTAGGTGSAGTVGTVGPTVGGAVGAWRSGKNEKQKITIVAWWNALGNKLWTYRFEETVWQICNIYIYIRRFVYALCLPVSDSSLLCWISDGHRKMDNTGKRLLPKHQEIYISTNSVSS